MIDGPVLVRVAGGDKHFPGEHIRGVVRFSTGGFRRNNAKNMAPFVLFAGVCRIQVVSGSIFILRHDREDVAGRRIDRHLFRPIHRGGPDAITG